MDTMNSQCLTEFNAYRCLVFRGFQSLDLHCLHDCSRAALQETSVLLDVLNIAKEKRYMVLDPVSQDPPESKVGAHIAAKKKVC